jgi:hypothetical protein
MSDRNTHLLLVLEDDNDAVDSLKRTLSEHNDSGETKAVFIACIARTASEAKDILRDRHIDCAILDLRVPPNADEEIESSSGNSVILEILDATPIPIVVYSGHTDELDPEIRTTPTKILTKEGGNLVLALQWLADQDRLMAALAEAQRIVRHETARLFHKSLWPRWDQKHSKGLAPEPFGRIIARQISSHLSEYFELSLADKTLSLSEEFYFIPSLRERLHTGDLVDIDQQVYIILTPQCDMVREYPFEMLLAKCEPEKDWIAIENAISLNKGVLSKGSAEKLQTLVNQNKGFAIHFIPPCGDRGPWNVNFRTLTTRPSTDIEKLKKARIASITPHFLPNLMSRLAAFMGRYGQPDLDMNELAKYAAGFFKPSV